VEDQNNYPSCHQSDYPKTIDPEGYLEEDSPEEEDSLEGEDTRAEEEYHLEDHQEVDGGHPRCQCPKLTKGS